MEYDKLFKAFADGNRIEIIRSLSQGVCCSCQFGDKFSISQPTLSYHLKMIRDCGLVSSEKDGTWMKYRINYNMIDEMIAFLNEIKANHKEECKC